MSAAAISFGAKVRIPESGSVQLNDSTRWVDALAPGAPIIQKSGKYIHIDVLRWLSLNGFAVFLLMALFIASLHAQSPCPSNVESVPFRNSHKHQLIVQVSINHARPSDFVLDTGAQMTVVDQSLAAELHLQFTGNAIVAGMSLHGQSKFAQVDSLEVGNHVSTNHRVLVYNMNGLQRAGFAIRGLLGQDFLSRFDVLIDNAHNVLCMDDTGALEAGLMVRGNLNGK